MTTLEMLRQQEAMNQANEKAVLRMKAKDIYSSFVRKGQYLEGRTVLEMIRYGYVTLWLSDEDWNVQTALEKAGFYIWYSRNGNKAEAHMQKGR